MQGWIPDIAGMPGPKYLAIADAMARDIEGGLLTNGDRLLPQRVLAQALGIDLTTVTRAYGEAQRRGLIEGSGRRGSFIRAGARELPALESGDAGMNAPPDGFGGSLAREFRRSCDALLGAEQSHAPFQYQKSGGAPFVRQAGAEWLAGRGIPCDEDTVLVAAGGQHALHAIFNAELRAGDTLAVCAFVYPGLLALARRFGVALRAIASDEEGMVPEALAAACAELGLRGVYLVPTNDNPTTLTMSVTRRQAIAQVAQQHGLLLIEDDAYGFLPEHPLPPLASLAPRNTWYIASMSKALAPGLRVAWLRAPDIAGAWRLAADMHETAIMAPPLNAAVVADWFRMGMAAKLIAEVRDESRKRQALVRAFLPSDAFLAQEEGYHLWIPLVPGANARHLIDAVRQHGLVALAGEAFAVEPDAAPALRVSIGGTISRERLQRGLMLLAALIGLDTAPRIGLV